MSKLIKGYGEFRAGRAAKKSAFSEAKQLERRAGLTRASSQRAAVEERRDARYLASKARARAAASGAGVSDPTLVDIFADIDAGGEYNALARLFEGEEAARGDEFAAKIRRREGRAAKTAGKIALAASILDQGETFSGKYG